MGGATRTNHAPSSSHHWDVHEPPEMEKSNAQEIKCVWNSGSSFLPMTGKRFLKTMTWYLAMLIKILKIMTLYLKMLTYYPKLLRNFLNMYLKIWTWYLRIMTCCTQSFFWDNKPIFQDSFSLFWDIQSMFWNTIILFFDFFFSIIWDPKSNFHENFPFSSHSGRNWPPYETNQQQQPQY